MTYSLDNLPQHLKDQGWKVKIRDKERAEPPHVSIIKKKETWRWSLRDQSFLDKKPPPKKIPAELTEHLRSNLEILTKIWDQMYPHNQYRRRVMYEDLFVSRDNNTSHVRASVLKKFKVVQDSAFDEQLTRTRDESLWISEKFDFFQRAFRSTEESIYKNQIDLRKRVNILLIGDVPLEAQRSLEAIFKEAIVIAHKSALPIEELLEVVGGKNSEKYVIGGLVDKTTHTITLIRGDLSKVAVPFSSFHRGGQGIEPDFSNLTIDDSGQTVKLGAYEASVDAIFYEFDPTYRKKRKRELASDKGFGACLRRYAFKKN